MKKLRLLTSHALSNKMLIPGIVFIFLESVRQAQYMWFLKKKHEGLVLQLTGVELVCNFSRYSVVISMDLLFFLYGSSVVIRNANSKSP